MDPVLLTVDDKNKAPPASLRSPDFRRLLRLVRPHRRFIVIGIAAAVTFGFLSSVGIIGMLPVLKVMLTDEGLHGWIYRSAVEKRLGIRCEIQPAGTPDEPAAGQLILLLSLRPDSDLAALGVRPLDQIQGYQLLPPRSAGQGPAGTESTSGRPIQATRCLQELADAPANSELALRLVRPAGPGVEPYECSLALRPAPLHWRLLPRLAAWVPPESRPRDRVITLTYVMGFVVVVVLISSVARFVAEYSMAVGVLRGVMDLRRAMYRKILHLPMAFFAQNTSDLVSRFVQDAQEIQRGLTAFFGKLLIEPIKAVFILAAALVLNARMTLVMLLIGPVAILIFWAIGRKIRKANKRLLKSYGVMIGALSTTLHAIGIVKAYNAENLERRRLWQIDRKMFGQQLRIARLEAFLRPMLEVLAVIGVAAVSIWLGAQVIQRQIKVEEFGLLVIALAILTDPLRKLSDVYPRVMRSAAAARRVFSVIDTPEESELLEGAVELPPLSQAIELRNVSFTYPNTTAPALVDVSVAIGRGETVAIVGPNGSGKTTLTRLLTRFYDPQSGQVLFDGLDVRQATLRSLRRQISLVTQDPVVFAMTVAENIAYGAREPEPQAIEAAARRAHADTFIIARPAGYDDPIGEAGGTLSGGQRQRLCIARAIMRNAPILIFDEATSQIDSESEQLIQQAVREFSAGRTTLIIAHRLSTIRFAERIIVMESGRIIDIGTHEGLFARCPLYAALCHTQFAK